MIDLSGKVALITGASRGIGQAIAHVLASYGASVVLVARNQAALDDVAASIQNARGTATAFGCDVCRYADVSGAVQHAVETFGRLDILINNAGVIEPIARLSESDPLAWGEVIDVNLKGVYHGIRAAAAVMEGQRSGIIVNLSSGAATSALEGWSHYCASKAAVLSLTGCADKELRPKGIRVVGLSPGTVETNFQVAIRASGINPVSQLDPSVHIPASWVGQAVAWLCTDDGAPYAGGDFSLKTDEARQRVGIVPPNGASDGLAARANPRP